MPRTTKRSDTSRQNEGARSQSTSPTAAATELEALHENALAALQDMKQSIAGGPDPYKLPALGPRRDDMITAVHSPSTVSPEDTPQKAPILDAATQQALFTRLLVLELSSPRGLVQIVGEDDKPLPQGSLTQG